VSWWRGLLGGERLPKGFAGRLAAEERVLATGSLGGEGGAVVASTHGLWLPDGRRIGWHVISKATWGGGTLTLVEAEEIGTAGGAVLLRDLPARRLPLGKPGAVPEVVHKRVTGSIKSRHHRRLPSGGAWFVQRRVPGRDGVVLQVRPDPGTDIDTVRQVAAEVVAKLKEVGK
jgi:hypothetical protein